MPSGPLKHEFKSHWLRLQQRLKASGMLMLSLHLIRGREMIEPDQAQRHLPTKDHILTYHILPLQLAINIVLPQKGEVVRFQGFHIRKSITLGVKVKLVELLDPFQRLGIFLALKLCISALVVPRVEGMKPDHVQATFWKGATIELQHLVHVLIMAPGHEKVADAALRQVHPELGAIHWVMIVRITFERFRENNCFSRGTSYWKSVSNNCPLLQDVITCNLGQSLCPYRAKVQRGGTNHTPPLATAHGSVLQFGNHECCLGCQHLDQNHPPNHPTSGLLP